MKKIIIILLALFIHFNLSAQVSNEGLPKSWDLLQENSIRPIILPTINLEKYHAEDLMNDSNKSIPWRFGAEIIVDYNLHNSGVWTQLENGDRIWRIRLQSEKAKTMNFVLSDFFMPIGATLYLYNHDKTDLLGAYDHNQNNTERVLGTWLVNGDDIYLEYFEPKNVENQGKLEIFKIIHGYRVASDRFKNPESGLNDSANCNYDVNCSIDQINLLKERSKKAVALIIVNNDSHCTGTLINNTNNNGTPYFLTANHCYSNPATWSFRFNWISENPICSGVANSTNSTNHNTSSGATLKARSSNTDFALLQLNNSIPLNWGVTYAGWNRSTTAPDFTYGVHHPAGDIMKVCLDIDKPLLINSNKYWKISSWDYGVTEGGSSGSGLFDNNGRLIGQLYGGLAGCLGLNYNEMYDQYGAIATSWDGTSATSRLKDWLDPTNSGVMQINQYPSVALLSLDAAVNIENLDTYDCNNVKNPSLKIKNNGLLNLTSLHYKVELNNVIIAESDWTGSLASGASTLIDLVPVTGITGNNTIKVTATLPNGSTDLQPLDNVYSKTFINYQTYTGTSVTMNLTTDSYADETEWSIEDSEGNVIASNGNMSNNTSYMYTVNLNHNTCYKFIIADEYGDGICCSSGNGSFSLVTNNGVVLASGGNFGASVKKFFRLVDPLSVSENSIANVNIYPNPSTGLFQINHDILGEIKFEVYNLLGQKILNSLSNNSTVIDLTLNPSGIYLVKIFDQNNQLLQTKKIVKN